MTTTGSALYQAILRDPETRARILSLPTLEARIQAAVAVGRKLGLSIGEAEVRDLLAPPSEELSDTELSAVVGGKTGSNLTGTDGDDKIFGSISGDNQLDGGGGNDWIVGYDGDDQIQGGDGDDTINSGWGGDTLDGGGGDDLMDGGQGDDTMSGGEGDDVMYGDDDGWLKFNSDGDDLMDGGDGDDMISGQNGEDTLIGGAGDDTLDGGDDNDILSGGSGSDVFVFDSHDGQDVITDFRPGEDQLAFNGIQNPGQLGVTVQEGSTVITYGDTTVTLEGVEMTAEQVWANVQHD
ncbi:MAG: hypothetical protein V3571_00255 [Pseudodesulfovibrio sp.]